MCRKITVRGSGSVNTSHQTVSGASKNYFLPSIFDTRISSFKMWNLQSYPTTVLNERMWHFRGRNMLWPLLHIFRGVRIPNLHDLRPCTAAVTLQCFLESWYYCATLCVSAVFALARCPSVCLSRWCILSTWLKLSSNFFVGPVAPSF